MPSSMKRLVILLVIAGCAGDPRPVPMVGGIIDSFEDGDELNALAHSWEAVGAGEGARTSFTIDPGGFDSGSKYHLSLQGVRPEVPSGNEVAGIRTSITQLPPLADPARDERPRDLTGFSGLSLAIRGTPGTYIVQIGTSSVEDFDYFNAYVEVTPEWSEFKLPFSSFKQEGFGVPRPWTGTDVSHVAVYANLPGYFEFGIDDVRFHSP